MGEVWLTSRDVGFEAARSLTVRARPAWSSRTPMKEEIRLDIKVFCSGEADNKQRLSSCKRRWTPEPVLVVLVAPIPEPLES